MPDQQKINIAIIGYDVYKKNMRMNYLNMLSMAACKLITKRLVLQLAAVLASFEACAAAQNNEIIPPIPEDPLVLFYASFDKTIDEADIAAGDPEMVGATGDRSVIRNSSGIQQWQFKKDIKAFHAKQGDKGRIGKCLQVPLGKTHIFRSLGNVSARAGTISFWVCFDRDLPGHAPIFSLGSFQNPGIPISFRVREKTFRFGLPAGGEIILLGPKMEIGRWYHVAVAYDCVQGAKVYVDGKLCPKSKWGKPEFGWRAEGQFADLMYLDSSSFSGASMPVRFDELRVFSRTLGPSAIAALAEGRPLPAEPELEPERDKNLWANHRLRELGWDVNGDYLNVHADGLPLLIRKIGFEDVRDVKGFRYGAVDGVEATQWPTTYHGYEITNGGLHLAFTKTQRLDYITIRGNYAGRMYAGMALAEPDQAKAAAKFTEPAQFIRRKLAPPVSTNALSIFRKDDSYHINELGLYSMENAAPEAKKSIALYLTGNSFTSTQRWITWSLRSHYEPADRVCLALASSPQTEQKIIVLRALRHAHLFVPAGIIPGGKTAVARIRIRLFADDLKENTRLRIQMRDPVEISRTLLDWDCRLAAGKSPAYDLILDVPGFTVPEGEPLWLTFTPENDLRVHIGGVDRQSRLEFELDDSGTSLAGRVQDLLHYAKDRFIHVSEPRPWGHVPMNELNERMLVFRQLGYPLAHLKKIAPDNDKVQAIWTWVHPDENPEGWGNMKPPAADGAPLWAVYAKESMKKYREFALWWIDNLQIPNGLFGSFYGDDTDLVNDWLSIGMICDPDGRIKDSLHRLAEYCWNEGPLDKGINRRLKDTLHCYEEGVNTMPHNAALYYGNPIYLERLMETSRTVRDYLTYTTPDNRRFFKSCWYGSTRIDTEFEHGMDFPGNALLLHPALYLAYYARNEGAVKLLREWGGAWCDLLDNARREKKPYPIRVKYPTAEIGATTEKFVSGYGFDDMCLGLYSITREEKYFTPALSWLDYDTIPPNVTADWMAVRDMTAYYPRFAKMADSNDWADLQPSMSDDKRCARAYLGWRATKKKEYVVKALEESWKKITYLFPMHTWAEQSADRVAVSKTLVDRLYLGGTPGFRNKIWPTQTVSWSGFGEEFAAWVLETTPQKLLVWIYNFEPQEQKGNLHTWLLEGTYAVRMGPDANEDEIMDSVLWKKTMTLSRNTAIPLTLPPGQLVIFEAVRTAEGAPLFPRPDLALVEEDIKYDPAKREVSITVHNMGSAEGKNIRVDVALDGKPFRTLSIPSLEAPNDLSPRTVKLTVPNMPSTGRITVTVDPENRIPEIWEGNNQAERILK